MTLVAGALAPIRGFDYPHLIGVVADPKEADPGWVELAAADHVIVHPRQQAAPVVAADEDHREVVAVAVLIKVSASMGRRPMLSSYTGHANISVTFDRYCT